MNTNALAAQVSEQGIVQQVIVIPDLGADDGQITDYCNQIGLVGNWLACSYAGAIRGRYPGVGDLYDQATDEFLSPQPITD